MTSQKHLKERIRARMARTGERYTAARRHVVGDTAPVLDHGHPLTGGTHPDSAAVAALLARNGRPVSEAMALGVGGGVGAGYILWEFDRYDAAVLTLGFRHRWNYLDWADTALTRLGAVTAVHTTSGVKGAATALDATLAEGRPALTWPDWHNVGYWHLPPHLDGRGGHGVLAYAERGGRVRVDDRNAAPLTVDRADFDRARARVSSYRNRLVTVTELTAPDLPAAVRAGIADTVAGLGGTSASFAVPAWRKWARLVTDKRHAKGWPTVFADGRGLVTALASIWEAVAPAGMEGGHLRDLYADFLDEAAGVLDAPSLTGCAAAFREAGERWRAVGDVALPVDVPAYERLRSLTAAVAMGVAAGDAGAEAAAEAATELWALRAEYGRTPPAPADLPGLGAALHAAHDAEHAATTLLTTAL